MFYTNLPIKDIQPKEGFYIEDNFLYEGDMPILEFNDNRVYIISLPSKYYWFYSRYLYEAEVFGYLLKWLLGETLPAVVRNMPTPHVWEKFLSIKKKKDKIKYLYEETGKKGLACIAEDTKTWEIKGLCRVYLVDDKKTYFKEAPDRNKYFRFAGQYFRMGDHYYNIGGNNIPFSFIIQYYEECPEHGVYFGSECPKCAAKYIIQEYHAKAEQQLPWKNGGEKYPDYMGIELEYEDCKSQVKAVLDAMEGHVIIKRDGSISDGFEIVTTPATLSVHKEAFKGFFEKVKVKVKRNCGMHVHVDKRKMGEMQKGKLLAFLYKKENIPWIEDIAGRAYSTNSYCKVDRERNITDGVYARSNFYEKVCRHVTGRYEALNLSPPNTIEFRIFAPPLDERTLHMRLEFVQALVDWTKPGVCSVKDASSKEKFIEFVVTYKKFYPNLYKEIKCA